ncbi:MULTISPECIES: hypothetical protein, partial [unclassified Arthrobacter]|uniref:hypothetical protein n=1 Tax=unclassified Arthrobacter TaxID=235627 RepID=UPI001C6131DF
MTVTEIHYPGFPVAVTDSAHAKERRNTSAGCQAPPTWTEMIFQNQRNNRTTANSSSQLTAP